ncbi:MAG: hypothetical protein K2X71_00560 [Methylobacterium sp.]|uniref:hypothetical protein n=1 Tax=Methylobacterium sp. TaxID=409 RepID=UPI00258790D5|nr:hypothetical protein [Methylobacterium sp.]MBY0294520.1 hypothetical protein [Methylobacterium sp.]
MSDSVFAFLKIALVFGIVLGLGFWQLWVLRRDRKRGEAAARAEGRASRETPSGRTPSAE